MFLGVALGAFGSHALKGKVSDYHIDIYKTGVFYHFVHALGLFAIAWLSIHFGNSKFNLAGIFLTAGIIVFSGSLYIYSITNFRWLGFVTPIGGLCFLIGWCIVSVNILK